jgi:SanA protein
MGSKKESVANNKIFSFLLNHKTVFLIIFILFSIAFMLGVDFYVGSFSDGRLFRDINDVPHRRAALVLGCGRYFEGRINMFYLYRINAATQLWRAGKIDAILVSGDNSRKDYDEPTSMKSDLVAMGIPAEYITIDYAGFRTLDSIVRAEKVFKLEDYIIVSQPFHCSRAIYLASQNYQDAIGWCARDVESAAGLKLRLREVLARNKALFDVLIHKNPKYLGKQELVTYKTSGNIVN